jgi:very-short-patch-repair endonuclease
LRSKASGRPGNGVCLEAICHQPLSLWERVAAGRVRLLENDAGRNSSLSLWERVAAGRVRVPGTMRSHRLLSGRLLANARALRHGQSTPEGVLWSLLRDRRLLGLKFRRQHPVGPYVLDFYCADFQWGIEADGGQHNTEQARAYDGRRSAYLASRGVTVTRFWNDEVMGQIDGVFLRLADVAGKLAGETRTGTLTPALSQREREDGSTGPVRTAREGGRTSVLQREREE